MYIYPIKSTYTNIMFQNDFLHFNCLIDANVSKKSIKFNTDILNYLHYDINQLFYQIILITL